MSFSLEVRWVEGYEPNAGATTLPVVLVIRTDRIVTIAANSRVQSLSLFDSADVDLGFWRESSWRPSLDTVTIRPEVPLVLTADVFEHEDEPRRLPAGDFELRVSASLFVASQEPSSPDDEIDFAHEELRATRLVSIR